MGWWLILPLLLIIFVVVSEPMSQDARPGRKCYNSTEPVKAEDNLKTSLDKTMETLRKHHTLVGWRRSLLIGLLVAIPICFLVLNKFPAGFQFLGIVFLVTIGAYVSTIWIEYFWWFGRDRLIEQHLLDLRKKV